MRGVGLVMVRDFASFCCTAGSGLKLCGEKLFRGLFLTKGIGCGGLSPGSLSLCYGPIMVQLVISLKASWIASS